MDKQQKSINNTQNKTYTERLIKKQTVWWKRLLDVQAPYRWNLKRLKPGFTLDIGCGIGRNLINLKGKGVGIDHNFESVQIAQQQGLIAFTPDDFLQSSFNIAQSFDSILLSHVAEHMNRSDVISLLEQYLYLLKPQGKVIIITPQEAGYKSDSTHVEFMNFPKLRTIAQELNLTIIKEYSFPFPRFVGYVFLYNEFISVSYLL
jgi:2-polyprenyl-3-methyl-5-hydroxy-6-metoxy-1,4-benzoquinol methylase